MTFFIVTPSRPRGTTLPALLEERLDGCGTKGEECGPRFGANLQ